MQEASPETSTGGGLIALIMRTGPFAMFILLLLLFFSLLSWTIILRKWLTFRDIDRQSAAFLALFHRSPRLSEVSSVCEQYHATPLAGLFAAAYQELNAQIQAIQNQTGERNPNPGHTSITEKGVGAIHRALMRASTAELTVLEKSMSWLATTASVTPFIGLLGTVIGIINAFEGLGLEKTASIQAVAPGIAEALIATAAGLFAAIPAVIGFNQFVHKIKNIGSAMDDFSSEFINLVERSFS